MKYKEIKEVLEIIEQKRLPIIIIFSLVFIPNIIFFWTSFFLQNQTVTVFVTIILTSVWIWAIYLEWQFRKDFKDKTRLISYLKRHGPYRSFNHINEAIGFTEKRIKKLISKFPEELNDVPMSKHGPGVGINKSDN